MNPELFATLYASSSEDIGIGPIDLGIEDRMVVIENIITGMTTKDDERNFIRMCVSHMDLPVPSALLKYQRKCTYPKARFLNIRTALCLSDTRFRWMYGGKAASFVFGNIGADHMTRSVWNNVSVFDGVQTKAHVGSGVHTIDYVVEKLDGSQALSIITNDLLGPSNHFCVYYSKGWKLFKSTAFLGKHVELVDGVFYGTCRVPEVTIGHKIFQVRPHKPEILNPQVTAYTEGAIVSIEGVEYKMKKKPTADLIAVAGEFQTCNGTIIGKTEMSDGLYEYDILSNEVWRKRSDKTFADDDMKLDMIRKAPTFYELCSLSRSCPTTRSFFVDRYVPSFADIMALGCDDPHSFLVYANKFGYYPTKDAVDKFRSFFDTAKNASTSMKLTSDILNFIVDKCMNQQNLSYSKVLSEIYRRGLSFSLHALSCSMFDAGIMRIGSKFVRTLRTKLVYGDCVPPVLYMSRVLSGPRDMTGALLSEIEEFSEITNDDQYDEFMDVVSCILQSLESDPIKAMYVWRLVLRSPRARNHVQKIEKRLDTYLCIRNHEVQNKCKECIPSVYATKDQYVRLARTLNAIVDNRDQITGYSYFIHHYASSIISEEEFATLLSCISFYSGGLTFSRVQLMCLSTAYDKMFGEKYANEYTGVKKKGIYFPNCFDRILDRISLIY